MKRLFVISVLILLSSTNARKLPSSYEENYSETSDENNNAYEVNNEYDNSQQNVDENEDIWLQNENKNHLIKHGNELYRDEFYDLDDDIVKDIESRKIHNDLFYENSKRIDTKQHLLNLIMKNATFQRIFENVDLNELEVRPTWFHNILCEPRRESEGSRKLYYFKGQCDSMDVNMYIYVKTGTCWEPLKFHNVKAGCQCSQHPRNKKAY